MESTVIRLTAAQLKFEWLVALKKLQVLNGELDNDLTDDERIYAKNRRNEIAQWISSIKDDYMEVGADVSDIPF